MLKFRLPFLQSSITALSINKLLLFAGLPSAIMFKVLVHGCQEARCKPLIHVIQTSNRSLIFTQELAFFLNEGGFPFRKPLGVIFVALRNFFEALDHTLVQGGSTLPPKVSDFIRPWRTPVALLGQDFDRLPYFESPFVACR